MIEPAKAELESRPSGSGAQDRRARKARYELLVRIASGGTATVYVGRPEGSVGLSSLVAIKRAHPHMLDSQESRRMLVEEARLTANLRHPNVVAVHDVDETDDELLLVMDYVEGATLAHLVTAAQGAGATRVGPHLWLAVLLDACAGLAAAHESRDEEGKARGLMHRDVSPQNILVGVNGVARLSDFGLAKRVLTDSSAVTGTLKGKMAYLAPEYVQGARFTSSCDIFAMGVVCWETLTGERLFRGQNEWETVRRILHAPVPLVSAAAPAIGTGFDAVVSRALDPTPQRRWSSVRDLAEALREATARHLGAPASREEVGAFVAQLIAGPLERRREQLAFYAALDDAPTGVDTVSIVGSAPASAPAPVDSHMVPAALLEPDDAETFLMVRPPAHSVPAIEEMQEPVTADIPGVQAAARDAIAHAEPAHEEIVAEPTTQDHVVQRPRVQPRGRRAVGALLAVGGLAVAVATLATRDREPAEAPAPAATQAQSPVVDFRAVEPTPTPAVEEPAAPTAQAPVEARTIETPRTAAPSVAAPKPPPAPEQTAAPSPVVAPSSSVAPDPPKPAATACPNPYRCRR